MITEGSKKFQKINNVICVLPLSICPTDVGRFVELVRSSFVTERNLTKSRTIGLLFFDFTNTGVQTLTIRLTIQYKAALTTCKARLYVVLLRCLYTTVIPEHNSAVLTICHRDVFGRLSTSRELARKSSSIINTI